MSTAADPLAFEAPLEENAAKWDAAEKQALRFPEKLVEKSRELCEAVKDATRNHDERDRIWGLVVRHLMILASNCKAALAELAPEPAAVPAAAAEAPAATTETAAAPETAATSEPTPAAEAIAPETIAATAATVVEPAPAQEPTAQTVATEAAPTQSADRSIEAMTLGGVDRVIAQLLAELGVYRVDLLGRTYEDVVFDGQKVEDPFEVLEAQQRGKASEIKVLEVVSDLWVTRQGERVKVLQRGKVIC